MPFTASILQIGGYHSYQHRKLQAAQVTITEPDSHEGHTTCCLFAVVMHRGTFQWKGQYLNSPGLGPTRHTFRKVADEASKAETALSGSMKRL